MFGNTEMLLLAVLAIAALLWWRHRRGTRLLGPVLGAALVGVGMLSALILVLFQRLPEVPFLIGHALAAAVLAVLVRLLAPMVRRFQRSVLVVLGWLLYSLLARLGNGLGLSLVYGFEELQWDRYWEQVIPGWLGWLAAGGPLSRIDTETLFLLVPTAVVLFALRAPGGALSPRLALEETMSIPSAKNDVTRLALASAVLLGSFYRMRVINRLRQPYVASVPEPGLDAGLLYRVCCRLEQRETRFQLAQAGGAVGVFLVAAAGMQPVAAMILLAMGLLQVAKKVQERFALQPLFTRDRFDLNDIEQRYPGNPPPTLPPPGQNVVTYSGFNPFDYSGIPAGGWSFALDASRARKDLGAGGQPKPFEMTDLYEAVDDAVASLRLSALHSRDMLFVNGADLPQSGPLHKDTYARPRAVVEDADIAELMNSGDQRVRGYKWISSTDWGGHLVVSYFLRCTRQGNNLFVEASRFVLPPVGALHRLIDRMPRASFLSHLAWFVFTVAISLPAIAVGLLAGLAKLMTGIVRALDIEDSALRRQIRRNPRYNWGAPAGLRRTMAGKEYDSYFQSMDQQMYEKALERQILDAIVDFLAAHDIDVSDIRERQTTILNHGIMIQSGNVRAGALAVGSGARAGMKAARAQPAAAAR